VKHPWPYFKLTRVMSDGSREALVLPVHKLTMETRVGRRAFFGVGSAATTLGALVVGGCGQTSTTNGAESADTSVETMSADTMSGDSMSTDTMSAPAASCDPNTDPTCNSSGGGGGGDGGGGGGDGGGGGGGGDGAGAGYDTGASNGSTYDYQTDPGYQARETTDTTETGGGGSAPCGTPVPAGYECTCNCVEEGH
jgi:hypothetical protein